MSLQFCDAKNKSEWITEKFFTNNDAYIDCNKTVLENSKIVNFYKGKTVFVTGATGFLGKLLVEKLLRSCRDIDTIYVLIRTKKGENAETRVEKLYQDAVFSPLRKISPNFQEKIKIIKGDIALPDLGLNVDDKKMIMDNVNIIYHIAATVRFDEKIKTAVAINIRGTRDIINIANSCKNLHSFVYVSTAYANCLHDEINEIFYKDSQFTTDQLIDLTTSQDDETLDRETPRILGKWPNTYAFTKAVAENTVKDYAKNLPICVYRPAIVIATYKEPLKSWIDNFYGATGVVIGAGCGVIKTLHCHSEKRAELVPADYVINGMIAASYKTAINKSNQIPIYNYVSSPENPLIWQDLMDLNQKYGTEIPTIHCIWYYCLMLIRHYYVNLVLVLFLHMIPAIVMDTLMVLSGQKPVMMKVYKKINKFSSVIAYFSTNQWKFTNNNTQMLWQWLPDNDKQLFPFSMKEFDWDEYSQTHIMGLRIYVMKDDPSTLPVAKKKWKRYKMMHNGIKLILYTVLIAIIYKFVLLIGI